MRAAGVELSTESRAGNVEAEDLVTQEVRAGGETRRDGNVPLGATLTKEVGSPGEGLCRVIAELANLDPRGTSVALEGAAVVVGAMGDVVHDRAAVGTVPLVPDEGSRNIGQSVFCCEEHERKLRTYTLSPALSSIVP